MKVKITYRRGFFGIVAGILIWSVPSQTHALSFSDVDGYRYSDSVMFLANRGVVKGYPDGTYGVDKPISRGELLKIILEGLNAPTTDMANCFSDVAGERYAEYICYAKNVGIAKGYPDGTFKPDSSVTIAEGLKMTLNSFDIGVQEGSGEGRYDPYIDFVHNNTIFSKYAIYPWSQLTRGQMAFLVHKLILNKEGTKPFTNTREVKSNGCGLTPPAVAPTESVVDGVVRHYITDVGSSYNPNTPTKLIFAFHGRTNPNTLVRSYYGINKASLGNAIVVYPLGLPEGGPSRTWANPGDKIGALRDYRLFDQLLDEFKNTYCINTDEVYVMGHSLGGWFTNALGCFRGDVIRGIGTLGSSAIGKQTCAGPVGAMVLHNPADNLAPFSNGEATRDLFLKNNGCNPVSATPYTSPDTAQCVEYSCVNSAPVVRCPYTDSYENGKLYPHTWPKYVGQLIWDFWKK